jgi:hypothetical protein
MRIKITNKRGKTWEKKVEFLDFVSNIHFSRKIDFYLVNDLYNIILWTKCDKCECDMRISDFIDKNYEEEILEFKIISKEEIRCSYKKLSVRIQNHGKINIFLEEHKLCSNCEKSNKNVITLNNKLRYTFLDGRNKSTEKWAEIFYDSFLANLTEGINEIKIPCIGGFGNRGYSINMQGKKKTVKIFMI